MTQSSRSTLAAMLCAASVTAQLVSGRATRDALFLASLGLDALPGMLIAASVVSILLVAVHARWAARMAPATALQALLGANGVLFLLEWMLRPTAPAASAIILYLHTSAIGPLLVSGFWLIASGRLDPITAKQRFGRVAGAGTLGGLLGALLAERIAATFGAPAMLPALAVSQFVTAWLVSRLEAPASGSDEREHLEPVRGVASRRSDLRVIAEAPHLRHLAVLVLVGTTSAALLDYLFKAKAVEALGPGDQLLRFFALYYAAISLVTFILQVASSRTALERFGVGLTTSAPSIALLAGSVGALFAPGFGGLMMARAVEAVLRGSWFRAGYELFYTPIPASEKRAVKSVVDVSVDRLGDALGGGLVRLVVLLVPAVSSSVILGLAMACSVIAVMTARRLNYWYVRTLGKSLVRQAGPDAMAENEDGVTRPIDVREVAAAITRQNVLDPAAAAELSDATALITRDRGRSIEVLSREEGLSAGLVTHTIPLLAHDPLADHALFALRKVAEERAGQLIDALLDPNQDYTVRRRLARVFSVCVSQRVADGLMMVLDDQRFDVRFQAARSLAAIVERNPRIRIDRERIHDIVLNEVTVGRPVWESRRLLDGFVSSSPLDAFVRDRAGQSLAHVFTLLSLVLSADQLQLAFRSLQSEDRRLRGTALEYLEEVLPASIRPRLWPFLVEGRAKRPFQPHEQIIANLLQSSESVTLHSFARRA